MYLCQSVRAVLYQDAVFLVAHHADGTQSRGYVLGEKRAAYVHIATGNAVVNGLSLLAGDAVKIWDEAVVSIEMGDNAQVLLFDLPKDA